MYFAGRRNPKLLQSFSLIALMTFGRNGMLWKRQFLSVKLLMDVAVLDRYLNYLKKMYGHEWKFLIKVQRVCFYIQNPPIFSRFKKNVKLID